MKKTIGAKLAIACVFMILAFGIALQFKSIVINNKNNSTSTARAEELQLQLSAEREKNEALYLQIIDYKDQIDEFGRQAEESGGYAKILSQQLEKATILSGQTAVHGQGVSVTMSDSNIPNAGNVNENYFIIHDEDVLKVINELRSAGAEALSINGERILSISEIRCSGSVVSVNNNRYAAPFVIKAIGNAAELENALKMRSGVVDVLSQWGINIDIKTETDITIDAYKGNIEYKYAQTVK